MSPDPATDVSALGSLRSWVGDAVLAGGWLPAVSFLLLALGEWAVEGSPPSPEVLPVIAIATGLGAVLGLVVGPVVWVGARWAWGIAPILAFALGPVIGGFATIVLFEAILVAIGETGGRPWQLVSTLLGFGAVAFGGPWVAYLAVRSRQRRGTGVVLLSGCWMVVPVALLMVFAIVAVD